MEFIYPFIVSFLIVFVSELGDKTQLLVLSFSTKNKASNILLGVAIGTFFSHGLAILFGSSMASFDDAAFNYYLKIITYVSFIIFGVAGFFRKTSSEENESNTKSSLLKRFCSFKINYIFIVAISIIIGEIGDKTFLASLGLGLQYPQYKISLILGSICGMVGSNCIAIFFGRLIKDKLNGNFVEIISNAIFIVFGVIGLFNFFA